MYYLKCRIDSVTHTAPIGSEVGQDSLHVGGYCRGRPRPRVAMMLRWISLVPAAIVLGTLDM